MLAAIHCTATSNATTLSEMKADWSDIALYAAVARASSLAPAAVATGVSVPTLSRRMKALEARLGRRLFLHGPDGYTPTAEGRALLSRAERMEAAAAEIDAWSARSAGAARVRITCGTWMALHLSRHLPDYRRGDAIWSPDFVTSHSLLDVARREVDIAVRNRAPTQPWLAGRRVGLTRDAAYAASPDVTGWIGGSDETTHLPSERWLVENHAGAIVATANDPLLRATMAQAGVGRVILPVWVGDPWPGLVRVSDPIEGLESEDWIVSHHEARHEPPIRAALDAIGDFLSGRAA